MQPSGHQESGQGKLRMWHQKTEPVGCCPEGYKMCLDMEWGVYREAHICYLDKKWQQAGVLEASMEGCPTLPTPHLSSFFAVQ